MSNLAFDIKQRSLDVINDNLYLLDTDKGFTKFTYECLSVFNDESGDLYTTFFAFIKNLFECEDSEILYLLYSEICNEEKFLKWEDLDYANNNYDEYEKMSWMIANVDFYYDLYSKHYFGKATVSIQDFIDFDIYCKRISNGVYPVGALYPITLNKLTQLNNPSDTYIGFYNSSNWEESHYGFTNRNVKFEINKDAAVISEIFDNTAYNDGCGHQSCSGKDIIYVPADKIELVNGISKDDIMISTAFPGRIIKKYGLPTI